MFYLIIFIVLIIGGIIGYQTIVKSIMQRPKNYPNVAAIIPNKKILVCAGDSITHGNMSYDWVKDLTTELADYQVFNAGINADLSYTLLNRLDDIIALKPDHINILIGGNDIVAQTRPLKKSDNYIKFNKIEWGTQPSLRAYEENLIKLITRLKTETTASMSIMSIAIIGENRNHPICKTVDNYNKVVKKVADTEGVTYLPLSELQSAYLQKKQSKSTLPFENTDWFIQKSGVLHFIFGWNWDKITKYHKHLLTFDNLHFNTKGASFIKDLLVNHLSEK
jgi:lysophospholipase L1-like esterase